MKFKVTKKSADGHNYNDYGMVINAKGKVVAEGYRWQFEMELKQGVVTPRPGQSVKEAEEEADWEERTRRQNM